MTTTLLRATTVAVAALLTVPLFAERQTVPNTIKYKDSSLPKAHGRAGAAALEVEALLGRDGTTDIELSAEAGTITKVQLKTGGNTENFNHLQDGNVTISADGLDWRQPLRILGHVRTRRTEVVTVNEVVKRRPDLQVSSISAPPSAALHVPVTIYATILELNGDVGARADARLLVNGAEVDRAEFIWVDAGGNVSVAFTHAFSGSGTMNLEVVVDNVTPADWDDANNRASTTISLAQGLDNWAVHAVERSRVSVQSSRSPQWHTNTEQAQTDQVTDFWGWIQHPVNLSSFALSVSARSDGLVLYDVPDAPFYDRFRESGNGASCTTADTWSPRIEVCFQPMSSSQAPNGFMLFTVHSSVGDVVYHSWGYDYSRDPRDPFSEPRGVYDVTTTRKETNGPLGQTVQWDFRFVDGDDNVYHSRPFLSYLAPGESHRNDPNRCFFSSRYGFEICTTYREDSYWREGWLTGRD